MSKIAIVTDIHVGARSASTLFCNHQIRFFEEVFFPKLQEESITEIVCCGDLFDTRKFTNHTILNEWKSRVFDKLKGYKVHLILGNHDIAYRNTLKVNSPSLFLKEYENIIIYDRPQEVDIFDIRVVFSPWICSANEEETFKIFDSTRSKILFGHFEINGFEMHRGQVATDGISPNIFKKFDTVFSGHFHHRSSNYNIHYIGNPYDLSWADYGDSRGFCIFDTSTLEFEYYDNPFKVHSKFYYDDKDKGSDYIKGFDFDNLDNTHVKVIVVNKTDLSQFDKFINRLYSIKLADLKIIEEFEDLQAENVSDEKLDLQDTLTLMESYINSIDVDGDKDKLISMVKGLYLEALRV